MSQSLTLPQTPAPLSERKLVFLIGALQFICTLDFMMVLPLGPDFARALGIPMSKLGIIAGSYTAAAALAGIAGAFFLDRFDRRLALVWAMAGLVLGTFAGGFVTGLPTLIAARMFAGAFGGPAAAIGLAVVSDHVAPERRGRALAAATSSTSVAVVLGVPAGLELAHLGGWRAPFFILAALGVVVTAAVMVMLPPQRAHLSAEYRTAPTPFRVVLRRPVVQLALAGPAIAAMANAALYPNIWAYFQFNRGYPRDQLSLLYLVGGTITFFTAQIAGWVTDRYGSRPVTAGGAAAYAAVLVCGFIYVVDVIPVLAIYVAYAVSQGFRMLPLNVLSSRVPEPHERARFMSALGSVECIAETAGAVIGVQLLTQQPDGSLAGIENVGWLAIALALVHVAICYALDRRVCASPDPLLRQETSAREAREAGREPTGGGRDDEPGERDGERPPPHMSSMSSRTAP